VKPVKCNFKNPFSPIRARLKQAKPARSVRSLKRTEKNNPSCVKKLACTILFPGNKKGYYDGPEIIKRWQPVLLVEPEKTED
jgi:hypothetical protein